jgi:hypothetical protein
MDADEEYRKSRLTKKVYVCMYVCMYAYVSIMYVYVEYMYRNIIHHSIDDEDYETLRHPHHSYY